MCRYCNYNLPIHYLLNDAPKLSDNIDEQLNAFIAQEDSDNLDLDDGIGRSPGFAIATEDLTKTDISVTEEQTAIHKLSEDLFDNTLQGQREYSAILANGEELPDWININSENGQLKIEPEYEEIGTHEIVVQATDQLGEVASSLVSLEVISKEGESTLLIEDQTNKIIEKESGIGYDSFIPEEVVSFPEISLNDVETTDSSVGRELTFTISLNAVSNETVTVEYGTADNTAVAGEDYIPVNGTITFAPGEKEKTVTVNTTGTSYLDPDESFTLNLSNSVNATIKDGQGEGNILPAYAGIRGGSRKQKVVTFSFFDEDVFGQGGYAGSDRESNAREPSEVVKANYRQIFDDLNTFVDREFVEVAESESTTGDIRIVVSDGPDYAYAGGHIHLAGWAAASDAGGNGWESPQGIYAYSALMHELGHAIGMPHSFGRESSVFDPEESAVNTVMSYTSPGNKPATFMSYDIKSLQERYGAAEYRPEDTVYEFVTVDNYTVDGQIAIDTTRRLKQTVWDSGGIDTFDFSGLAIDTSGYRFDLNQSKYQTTQDGYEGSSYSRNDTTYYVPTYGTSIAIDVEIENLVNSSSDDIIIANSAANTFSGYGLGLTTGHDFLIATDSLDTLDLSEFSFLDVAEIPLEVDLKYELGEGNSVTIKDYLLNSREDRINILLDTQKVSINDVNNIYEGDNGSKTATFTVNLAEASNELIEIDYATADHNAKAGQDYVAKTGTVTFNPGETSKDITVEILGDTVAEGLEGFQVNLLGNYGQIINRAYGLIGDNDGSELLTTITIGDAIVTRGNKESKAIFEVSIDELVNFEPITLDFTTQDNIAIAGEDYVAKTGTLVFSPQDRERIKTIEVDIIGDSLSNRDEDFRIELSNVSSNATIADGDGIGTIVDPALKIGLPDGTDSNLKLASYPPDGKKDPDNLGFEVSPNHSSLTIEGDGNGWKEIPLGDYIEAGKKPLNPYSVIEFDFKSSDEGKLHGIHFEGTDHHAFYSPWEKGRFFQLYGSSEFGIQDFNNYEDSIGEWKTYQIPVHQYFDTNNWRNFGNWVVFAHEGSSDDSNTQFRNLQIKELLPISVAGVTVSEGDGVAQFTLTIPEASTETITLDYATVDDTAIAGEDYTAVSGNVTFAPGETSKTIDVAISEDNKSEVAEDFKLNLSNVDNAIAINQTITATIADNDVPLPVISLGNISVDEGNSGTTKARVIVSLDKASTELVTVNYSTQDNTATAEDYQEINGQVTFNRGETSKTIEIEVNSDTFNETTESFYLNLDNAVNATLDNPQGEVTILNDDALPSINISDDGVLSSIPVKDSNGNIKNSTGLLFEVSLDAPSNQTIKVDYTTADGTAKAEEDYTAKDKTLTFQPGETEKQVFVDVTLDETTEADENLYLNLTNPENAIIADSQAVGTIEETRSLSVSDLEVSEDGTEALFTVSLDKPSIQGIFVNYITEDGTAKAGSDYATATGRLFIKAGEKSATIPVPLVNNNITEDDETFFLELSKPKYVLIADEQGQATILNDDAIPTVNPGGIYEGLQLWLKPDGAISSNDGKVTSWQDSSQGENDLTELFAGTNPNLNSKGINFNPTVEFDDTSDRLGSSSINNFPTSALTQFLVLQREQPSRNEAYFSYAAKNSSNEYLLFNSGDKTEVTMNNTSRNVVSQVDGNPAIFSVDWEAETGVGHLYNKGNSYEFTGSTSPLTAEGTIVLGEEQDSLGGGFSSSQAFLGQIAENIIFDRVLTPAEHQQVESYLGIKYGLTPDLAITDNYVNSDNQVWWNSDLAGEYSHDVAGIAKDNSSGLNQVKSRSSNNKSIVTITAEDTVNGLEDGEALVWGNKDRTADNYALKVDGVNDYVKIPDSDAIDFSKDQDFTIEVKVETDGSTAHDAIVEKWGHGGGYAFVIRYNGDGTVKAARYDGAKNPSVSSTTKINDGEFHHVAFVKSGDELQIYIDGELENTAIDTTTGTTTNNSPVYLGSRGGRSEFFNGNLENFRIWNTARTPAQIQASQGDVDPSSEGLIAYLPLETDANDLTSNGNNGTFHNGANIQPVEAIDLSQRIWQVQEKQGDVGTVELSFDLSQIGQQLPIEEYALQVSSDDTFSDRKFHTQGRKLEGNTLTFTGINFKDGEYFTLDTQNSDRIITPENGAIYVNAGVNEYMVLQGNQWLKGEGFSHANTFVSGNAIANTTDDAIYQSEYFGKNFSYQQAVENGYYDVTLKFAEVYFNQPGKRVFDVQLEDRLILDDFDIVSSAGGKNIAFDRTFKVGVNDGMLDLDFIASVDNAKISGIQIEPTDSLVTRINAGSNTSTEINGQEWLKGQGFNKVNTFVSGNAIANTADDAVYQSEYFGKNFSYGQAVENGYYDVTLKFAEVYFNQPGKRVFDVISEEKLILDDLDLVAEAGGKNIALDRTFKVRVNDGILDLDFIASVDNAKISGIQIEPADIIGTLINAGVDTSTEINGQQWLKGEGFNNANTFVRRNAIANTSDDAIYQSEYFGKNFSYQQALENGNYDVTLKFAEVYFNQPGKRVFDVTLEEQLILDNFDIVGSAGGKNIALDRTFNVQVNDGILNLDFIASVDNAKISGIEIEPIYNI